MTTLTEADVEHAALGWLAPGLGRRTRLGHRPRHARRRARRLRPGGAGAQAAGRAGRAQPRPARLARWTTPYRRLTTPTEGATLEARNRAFHRMLVNGVEIEYTDAGGRLRGDNVAVLDFARPARNDWLAVNQFTVTENRNTRRPDVVLFVNGLPLGVIELKNPTDEDATIWIGVAAAPDLQVRAARAVLHERGADGVGRQRGPRRHADGRQGVVQALAHRHRRDAGGPADD